MSERVVSTQSKEDTKIWIWHTQHAMIRIRQVNYLAGSRVVEMVFISCVVLLQQQARERVNYVKFSSRIGSGISSCRDKGVARRIWIETK
ncbi:hypothetical protein PanWU01x14_342600 [Parasponia andersonii]|uniref:Uncharacterized protein n=1 Tax=Parasponia andersonii TaxID=3476 RepID=A0A2P5ADQ4_PARAD|nr:hypothetical protein PanWU01x14_342600 [Parasponia andersonii]